MVCVNFTQFADILQSFIWLLLTYSHLVVTTLIWESFAGNLQKSFINIDLFLCGGFKVCYFSFWVAPFDCFLLFNLRKINPWKLGFRWIYEKKCIIYNILKFIKTQALKNCYVSSKSLTFVLLFHAKFFLKRICQAYNSGFSALYIRLIPQQNKGKLIRCDRIRLELSRNWIRVIIYIECV